MRRLKNNEETGGFILEGLESLTRLGAWHKLPLATRENIAKHKDGKVERFLFRRKPLSTLVGIATNWLTLGALEEFRKKAKYDYYFHLSCILRLTDGTILRYEKRDRAMLEPFDLDKEYREEVSGKTDYKIEYYEVVVSGPGIPLTELIKEHIEIMGNETYYGYDAFNNNCQNFLKNMLVVASNLADRPIPAKVKDEALKFIFQDISALIKDLPDYQKRIANILTNLGATVNNWYEYFSGSSSAIGGAKSKYNFFTAQQMYNKQQGTPGKVHPKGSEGYNGIRKIMAEGVSDGAPKEPVDVSTPPEDVDKKKSLPSTEKKPKEVGMTFFEASKIIKEKYKKKDPSFKAGVIRAGTPLYEEIMTFMKTGEMTEDVKAIKEMDEVKDLKVPELKKKGETQYIHGEKKKEIEVIMVPKKKSLPTLKSYKEIWNSGDFKFLLDYYLYGSIYEQVYAYHQIKILNTNIEDRKLKAKQLPIDELGKAYYKELGISTDKWDYRYSLTYDRPSLDEVSSKSTPFDIHKDDEEEIMNNLAFIYDSRDVLFTNNEPIHDVIKCGLIDGDMMYFNLPPSERVANLINDLAIKNEMKTLETKRPEPTFVGTRNMLDSRGRYRPLHLDLNTNTMFRRDVQ